MQHKHSQHKGSTRVEKNHQHLLYKAFLPMSFRGVTVSQAVNRVFNAVREVQDERFNLAIGRDKQGKWFFEMREN